MFAEIFFGVVKYTAMLLFGREALAAGSFLMVQIWSFLTVQFDLHISFLEECYLKGQQQQLIVIYWDYSIMVERASSDGSCSSQGWCGRCWGPGRCYPSWQPAQPPWLWCHRECPTRVWALLAAKPEWGSQAVSFRPPQLLPSPWSTELLLLKNRFFPQIWWWCARLMENPSSCCCKTPFPRKEGKFYCTTEPAEGMHLQFILVPPGNSIWHLRAVTALGLLRPGREALHVWAPSRDGGWSFVLQALL